LLILSSNKEFALSQVHKWNQRESKIATGKVVFVLAVLILYR
jgi:hypothetical protein